MVRAWGAVTEWYDDETITPRSSMRHLLTLSLGLFLLTVFLLTVAAIPSVAEESPERDGYADLVELFEDWRAFEHAAMRVSRRSIRALGRWSGRSIITSSAPR